MDVVFETSHSQTPCRLSVDLDDLQRLGAEMLIETPSLPDLILAPRRLNPRLNAVAVQPPEESIII
jgi:hypothetical protein